MTSKVDDGLKSRSYRRKQLGQDCSHLSQSLGRMIEDTQCHHPIINGYICRSFIRAQFTRLIGRIHFPALRRTALQNKIRKIYFYCTKNSNVFPFFPPPLGG